MHSSTILVFVYKTIVTGVTTTGPGKYHIKKPGPHVSKRKIPTLIVEHVSDRGNLHMLSMLEHRRDRYLVIVDNTSDESITAYVLDYAQQEGIDLASFIGVAEGWLKNSGGAYPLSFELSRLGMTSVTRRIHKTFDLAYVTRLVGCAFSFDLTTPVKIRRRRASRVPSHVEVRPKILVLPSKPAEK